MKSLVIAATTAIAAIGVAQAQSVSKSFSFYGNLDAELMTQNKSGATGDGGSATAFVDGGMSPTLLGVRGTRDLGDGLTGGFQLEAGFSLANGMHNNPGVYQSSVFGRAANITVAGNWGSLGFGLQLDPALIASIATEPRGLTNSHSHLEHWILATIGNGGGPTGASGSLQGGIFDNSAVSYSYRNNGLYVGLLHGFGGVAGSDAANSTNSLGASYSIAGMTFSGGYAAANSATPGEGKSSVIKHFGLATGLGTFTIRSQFAEFKSGYTAGIPANIVKSFGIGVDHKINEKNMINLAIYQSKDNGAGLGGKTREVATYYKYSLTPETTLYAQIAGVKADANAGLGAALGGVYVPSGLTASAGATTLYSGIGLQFAF
jgi:predicted porin